MYIVRAYVFSAWINFYRVRRRMNSLLKKMTLQRNKFRRANTFHDPDWSVCCIGWATDVIRSQRADISYIIFFLYYSFLIALVNSGPIVG